LRQAAECLKSSGDGQCPCLSVADFPVAWGFGFSGKIGKIFAVKLFLHRIGDERTGLFQG
jgi:hypothetical protein